MVFDPTVPVQLDMTMQTAAKVQDLMDKYGAAPEQVLAMGVNIFKELDKMWENGGSVVFRPCAGPEVNFDPPEPPPA